MIQEGLSNANKGKFPPSPGFEIGARADDHLRALPRQRRRQSVNTLVLRAQWPSSRRAIL